MRKTPALFTIILLFAINTVFGINLKRILRAIDRNDIEKAVEWLNEELEENSFNPGAYLIYSQLSSEDSLESLFNLDTARFFINIAISQYDTASLEIIEDLQKLDFERLDFSLTYSKIRKQVFKETLGNNTILAYNLFMGYYPDAEEFDQALFKRDSIAFADVSSINSWQSYKSFMGQYPDSEFLEEANKRYDRLLYLDETSENTVSEIEDFISNYPKSPYINEAVERLYPMKLNTAERKKYLAFISMYDFSPSVKEVAKALFHLDKRKFVEDPPRSLSTSFVDSLSKIYNAEKKSLTAFLELGQVGLMDASGLTVVQPIFTKIYNEDVFCSFSNDDLIAGKRGRNSVIVNRLNSILQEASFEDVKILDQGFIVLNLENSNRLITKWGKNVLSKVDDVEILESSWLVVERDEKFALCSFFGNYLTGFDFTEIYKLGDFIVFVNQEDELAIYNKELLQRDAEDGVVSPEFKFEDIELFESQYLIAYKGDQEALLRSDFTFLIPWGEQQVYADSLLYYSKIDSTYRLYNQDFINKVGKSDYSSVQLSDFWFIGQNDSWKIYNRITDEAFMKQYDSAKLITEKVLFVKLDERKELYFLGNRSAELQEEDIVVGLRNTSDNAEFVSVKREETTLIYDSKGSLLFELDVDQIEPSLDSTFIISKDGKKGLIDSEGQFLLEPKYDFLQVSGKGVNILNDGEIGYYDMSNKALFETEYEASFVPKMSYYSTTKDGLVGLLNAKGQEVVSFEFEEVEVSNERLAWVKSDTSWSMIEISSERVLTEGISSFKKLDENNYFEVLGKNGFGIVDEMGEYVIQPVYSDILLIQTENEILFRAEKYFQEADYYILAWYNKSGDIVYKNAYTSVDYEYLYCD